MSKSKRISDWRRRTKLKLLEYKGGKCELCGFNEPFSGCYDFHHLNSESKEFTVSGKTKSFETLKAEVDKCQLLCKNCHYELHDKEYAIKREITINKSKQIDVDVLYKLPENRNRKEMTEEEWVDYQRIRKLRKNKVYETKNAEITIGRKNKNKFQLVEYKGGKCELCGFDKKILSCFDFHHLNSTNKSFNISRAIGRCFESLKAEVDKCQLLCKNCHAKVHESEFENYSHEATIGVLQSAVNR